MKHVGLNIMYNIHHRILKCLLLVIYIFFKLIHLSFSLNAVKSTEESLQYDIYITTYIMHTYWQCVVLDKEL